MTADSTILIEVKAKGDGARVIKRDLDEISRKSRGTTEGVGRLGGAIDKTKNSIKTLSTAFAGFIAILGVGAIVKASDNFTLLNARIKNSTRSAEEFSEVLDGLTRSSLQTGTSLSDALDVFQRLSFVRDEISATAGEMVDFTSTVQRLGVISGANTGALSAGLTQLGQGLSAGVLRAEEFNSVVENIPLVAKTIADEFGVTTGELRKLVLAGEVLSEDVFAALLNQSEKVGDQFEEMPRTIAQATSALISQLSLLTGQITNTSGSAEFLTGVLDGTVAIVSDIATGFELIGTTVKIIGLQVGDFFNDLAVSFQNFRNRLVVGISDLTRGVISPELDTSVFDTDNSTLVNQARSELLRIQERLAKSTDEQSSSTREISKNYSDILKSTQSANSTASDTNGVLTQTRDITDDLSSTLDSAASDFGDGIIDAFRRGFESGEGFIGSFVGGISNAFQSLLADVTRSVAQPVVQSVLGSVTNGAFGSSEGILSSIGGANSGLTKLITSNFDKIGSVFGIENLSSSSTLTNGSFGGSIGGAAGGFIGNFGANAIFGGDRGIGANIGGAIGGIAGSFIPVPILGTAIGAFVGNAIGGLFGNSKPSDKRQLRNIDFETLAVDDANSFTGSKFSQQNSDLADQVADQIVGVVSLLQQAGAELEGDIDIRVGSRDGLFVDGVNADGNFIDTINQAILDSISEAPDDLLTVLDNIDIGDTERLVEALGILDLVRSFEDLGVATKPLGDALDALDAQFSELSDATLDLGLPIEDLTASYETQRQALITNTLEPLQSFLDDQALSGSSSLNDGQRLSLARSAFDENLSAIGLGDFSGLDNITSQATELLSVGRDVFASGEGFVALESFVRQSIAGIAGDLGAEGGVTNDIFTDISLTNAQQISIQEQILVELQVTREENAALRKAMERVGNSLVIQT